MCDRRYLSGTVLSPEHFEMSIKANLFGHLRWKNTVVSQFSEPGQSPQNSPPNTPSMIWFDRFSPARQQKEPTKSRHHWIYRSNVLYIYVNGTFVKYLVNGPSDCPWQKGHSMGFGLILRCILVIWWPTISLVLALNEHSWWLHFQHSMPATLMAWVVHRWVP